MKLTKYLIFSVAVLAILSTTAQAVPAQNVPDTASTMGLFGCAFAGLAGLRTWLNR